MCVLQLCWRSGVRAERRERLCSLSRDVRTERAGAEVEVFCERERGFARSANCVASAIMKKPPNSARRVAASRLNRNYTL